MSDPMSLGALGAVALSEGIKFVYDQAKELLKRWRAKRDREVVEVAASSPDVLDAPLAAAEVPEAVVADNAESLTSLRRALIDYAEEGRTPDPRDPDLLAKVDALRRLLELAYGQRITFKGEQREPTGSRVDIMVEANVVEGYLAGLRSRGGLDGVTDINADVKVDRVAGGGEVVGVDLDRRGH
jgi:hypothetical protein